MAIRTLSSANSPDSKTIAKVHAERGTGYAADCHGGSRPASTIRATENGGGGYDRELLAPCFNFE